MHKGFSILNRRFVLHELREAIRASEADIVLLQEVLGEHREHSSRWQQWPQDSQYEFLADSIWSDYAYGKNAAYPAGHHGNALLSKYPIIQQRNHDVSLYKHEQRGLLHCVLKAPKWPLPLHVICVHLGLFEMHRRQQLQKLCELIREQIPAHEPLLVGGDFNDWRGKAHDLLAEGAALREAFVSTHGRAARTFPVRLPMLRLDRLYVRNLDFRDPQALTGVPWNQLSDHAPLALELLMPA